MTRLGHLVDTQGMKTTSKLFKETSPGIEAPIHSDQREVN
jgi:hypothetical protein